MDGQRCGPIHPGPNGEAGICLPNEEYPCCGTSGWCGNSLKHCSTHLYRDFRLPGKVFSQGDPSGFRGYPSDTRTIF